MPLRSAGGTQSDGRRMRGPARAGPAALLLLIFALFQGLLTNGLVYPAISPGIFFIFYSTTTIRDLQQHYSILGLRGVQYLRMFWNLLYTSARLYLSCTCICMFACRRRCKCSLYIHVDVHVCVYVYMCMGMRM